ncbi:MAG: phosphotransferase [Bacillota bacterium]
MSVYHLLNDLGVPTLALHGRSERSLLLDDLAASVNWRAATDEDLISPETAEAVARWYRALHRAGRRVASDPPPFLNRETSVLNRERVSALAARLQMEGEPSMKLAAESIEQLKDALHTLPQTLHHNGFCWTNLALSRETAPQRAVVYDYHLMGVGPACCDCRNVLSVLEGDATAAFRRTYRPLPEEYFVLDEPLATLYALDQATTYSQLPAWAERLVRQFESGEFADSLRAALDVVATWCRGSE